MKTITPYLSARFAAGILLGWFLAVGPSRVQGQSIQTAIVEVGDRYPEVVRVTNTGNDPFLVTRVESSCPCLQVVDAPAQVAPGESGEVFLELIPDKPGDYRYEINVHTSDSVQPLRTYFLDVSVPTEAEASAARAGRERMMYEALQVEKTPRDRSLYRSVDEVKADLFARRPLMLVDVRPPWEYSGTHIPDSLNIPAWELKVRRFLRNKEVIVIDGGYGSRVCEDVCRELREAGFRSVHILQGGINRWHQSGGAVAGTGNGRGDLAELSASEFLASRGYADWMVFDTGVAVDARFSLEERERVGNGGQLRARVVSTQREEGNEGFRRVLVMDQDGTGYAGYRATAKDLDRSVVFYLEDGQRGLEKQLKDMAAIQTRSTKVVSGPGTGFEKVPIRKPCSTCP